MLLNSAKKINRFRDHLGWLVFGLPFLTIWPVLSQRFALVHQEELVGKALDHAFLSSLMAGHIPSWNPLVGPGGHHANTISHIGWDYRLLIKGITDFNESILFVIEFGILLALFSYSLSKFFNGQRENFVIFAAAFLYYFNIVKYQFKPSTPTIFCAQFSHVKVNSFRFLTLSLFSNFKFISFYHIYFIKFCSLWEI